MRTDTLSGKAEPGAVANMDPIAVLNEANPNIAQAIAVAKLALQNLIRNGSVVLA